MNPTVIATEGLSKSFGRCRAISDVNLRIEAGQVFGFLGPNGAGKSTTIRCLLGLQRPSSGRCQVLGQDPVRDQSFLSDVGYLPGELHLPETLKGADVLRRFARMRGLRNQALQTELVDRFAVEVNRPLRELSKGNKQKLGLVLAFMHRPRLLILDEPTSGLDPLVQSEFARLVRETANEGRTVLLSSHDLDEVQRVVTRVAIIKAGRIVADDTVEGLRAQAPRSVQLTFDHDVDLGPLRSLPGVHLIESGARQVSLTQTGSVAPLMSVLADLQPVDLIARPADLEELFLRLFGETTDER